MSVANGAAAAQALLGRVLGAGPPADLPLEMAPSGLSPDTLLTLLLTEVDDLVPCAQTELRPVRRRLFAWANPPDDAPLPTAAALERRDRALELTWVTVMQVGPLLREIDAVNRPELYLVGTRYRLQIELSYARKALGTAVAEALRGAPADQVEELVESGTGTLKRFPQMVTELYLKENGGLEREIDLLGERVANLLALRAERGSDALATGAGDVAAGVTQTVPGGPWFFRGWLRTQLQHVRELQDSVLADDACRVLAADVHSIAVIISLLETREQLAWFADQPLVTGLLDTRTRGYVTALGPALNDLADAAALRRNGNRGQAAQLVATALATADAVTAQQQYADDIAALQFRVQAQEAAVQIAKGVAIAAAVAIVTGGAGLLAEVTVAEAVVAAGTEISIAQVAALRLAAGTFVAFAETVTARGLTELLFGPGAVTTPFLTDLALNLGARAATAAVAWAAADVFAAARRYHPAAEGALRFTVGRIEMNAFAEVRTWITEGRLRTWDERARGAVEDLLLSGLLHGANLLVTRFSERTAAARGAMTVRERATLDDLDTQRAQVVSDFDRLRDGTATDAEYLAWAKRAADVWNRAYAVVDGMRAGLGRDAALVELVRAKSEAELRLAEIGIRADLSLPGTQPSFRALLPGLIEVDDEARSVLDAKYPVPSRLPSGVPDVERVRLPSGGPLLLLPAGTAPATPPPKSPPHTPEEVDDRDPELQSLDEVAARGLSRLRAAFGPAKVRELLRTAQASEREPFLALLGNPGFDGVALQNRIEGLRRAAASPASVTFGRRFGPLPMFRLLKLGQGAQFDKALDAATAALAGTPAGPLRDTLAHQIAAAGSKRQLSLLIGTATARTARRRPVKPENLGIDRAHPEWEIHHTETVLDHPNRTPAQQDVIADLRQTKQAARRGLFDDVAPERKLAMIVEIDSRQAAVGLNTPETTGPANARRGTIAEFVFLHRLTRLGFELQVPMEENGVPQTAWVQGRSIFDAYRVAPDGVPEHVEGKSHILLLRRDWERNATAFRAQGVADRTNMKTGARYYLWIFRDPGVEGREVMRDVLMAAGTPFTEIFFGPETPTPLR